MTVPDCTAVTLAELSAGSLWWVVPLVLIVGAVAFGLGYLWRDELLYQARLLAEAQRALWWREHEDEEREDEEESG